jgi:hypothetical protein
MLDYLVFCVPSSKVRYIWFCINREKSLEKEGWWDDIQRRRMTNFVVSNRFDLLMANKIKTNNKRSYWNVGIFFIEG